MGYRGDLIARLKSAGFWEKLTAKERLRYEVFNDDQARSFLVASDDPAENENDVEVVALIVSQLLDMFRGRLFDSESKHYAKLSRAGQLLAETILAFQELGVPDDEIHAGFGEFDTLQGLHLVRIYRGLNA